MTCMSCYHTCRNEFKWSNCWFEHTPPEELVKSQWQSRITNFFYLLYRWIIASYFISAVTVSMTFFLDNRDPSFYFIYLTNLGILLCMLTQVFGAVLVTYWHFNANFQKTISQSNEMPHAFKVYWGLHNSALVVSIIISLIYWTILHNSNFMPLNAANIMTHATNSVFMFIDVLIVAYPIRLLHVFQPIAVGILYCIFTVIYYAADGKDIAGNNFIYNVLDWSQPGLAFGTIFGTILLALVIHTILFYIYILRCYIYEKYFEPKLILPTTTDFNSPISMVLGTYDNKGYTGSTEKVN